MKTAPLHHVLNKEGCPRPTIVHTAQHRDLKMSDAFFDDLALSAPGIDLGVARGTHAEQTGKVMMFCEKVAVEQRPDPVVDIGDVNST